MKNKTFNKKDYSSNDGMLTTIWGPSMWHYLHTISFNFPNQPNNFENRAEFVLSFRGTPSSTPISGGPWTCTCVKIF